MAFGNVHAAALHAKAAAAFGLLAVAAGAGARVAANTAGLTRNSSSTTAAGALGQEEGPRNKQFTYNTGATPASSDGSNKPFFGAIFDRVTEKIEELDRRYQQTTGAVVAALHQNTQAVSRFNTLPPGVLVAEGADGASAEIASAFLKASGSDGSVNDPTWPFDFQTVM